MGYSDDSHSEQGNNNTHDQDGIWIQAGAEANQGIMIHTVDARRSLKFTTVG